MRTSLPSYIDKLPPLRSKTLPPKTWVRVAPGVRAQFDGKQLIVFSFKTGKKTDTLSIPFSGLFRARQLFVRKNKHRFELRATYSGEQDPKLDRRIERAAGHKADFYSSRYQHGCRDLIFVFKTRAEMDHANKRVSKLKVKTKARDGGEWV